MEGVLNPPQNLEARLVLHNISWVTYQRLLEELADSSSPRLTYDRGELEIISPTAKHEDVNESIKLLVNLVAMELGPAVRGLGSTTFTRADIERGFEPDSCFYVEKEAQIRGKERIDLASDPVPDIVVEIDITNSSLNKSAIFAQFGVPEIWRYDGTAFEILVLKNMDAEIVATQIVADDLDPLKVTLAWFADQVDVNLVITTGGTGFAPRDNTPEATLAIIERQVPGLPEAMRMESLKQTPMAMISRGVCGIRSGTLIINLPGSPKGVRESFAVIKPVLNHAIALLADRPGGDLH